MRFGFPISSRWRAINSAARSAHVRRGHVGAVEERAFSGRNRRLDLPAGRNEIRLSPVVGGGPRLEK
jgi:hypothetical protein